MFNDEQYMSFRAQKEKAVTQYNREINYISRCNFLLYKIIEYGSGWHTFQ